MEQIISNSQTIFAGILDSVRLFAAQGDINFGKLVVIGGILMFAYGIRQSFRRNF